MYNKQYLQSFSAESNEKQETIKKQLRNKQENEIITGRISKDN